MQFMASKKEAFRGLFCVNAIERAQCGINFLPWLYVLRQQTLDDAEHSREDLLNRSIAHVSLTSSIDDATECVAVD